MFESHSLLSVLHFHKASWESCKTLQVSMLPYYTCKRTQSHCYFFISRFTKEGKSLHLETKYHSHSVEPLSMGHACQVHWGPHKRPTAWLGTPEAGTPTQNTGRDLLGDGMSRSFVRDIASEVNDTFKIIRASRSLAPDGKQQRCGVPRWRLVLGCLKVDFWRDCPATSERAIFKGKIPCSPT